MSKQIEKLSKKSLSNDDILNFCDGKVKIITYKELYNFDSIDHLLYPNDACIILYETKESYGHWTCIIKMNKKEVEVFDSYGLFPDDEKKFIPKSFLKKSGQDLPILTKLLYECPYRLSFNEHQLQSKKSDMNTCGRWCIARVMLKHLSLKQFVKIFTNKKESPDYIVTLLTKDA